MSVAPGTRLGHYEIVSLLGEGGMGQVYRAKDTTLNRDVALKILPDLFTGDADRLARFKREAQVLASLNHPNIAGIYGFEDSGATHALLMELVDGEDLSAPISRGPLPVAEVLSITRQLADALEAAHEQGIVHRDLKPANIKVRPDGVVKVLDFGLAKAVAPDGATTATEAANSPTLTARATAMGMILGTAAYMSPEQARGKAVDRRADIWAFGVVLYEMLTGRRPFEGADVADVLAAVLRHDVDWSALPANTPPRLRRLLERCLDRNPKMRLRDMGEARVALAEIESGAPDTASAAAINALPRGTLRETVAWTIAGVAVVAAAIGIAYFRSTASTNGTARVVRLPFVPPDSVGATDFGTTVISPDGQKLLFTGRAADGRRLLWVRSLDATDVRPVPDSDDAIEPFWSWDSKSVGFGAQGKLKRVDLDGGHAQVLADAARLNGGSWSPTGVIVFSPDFRTPLSRVPAGGGPRASATRLDPEHGGTGDRYPFFLPDGRHFLYAAGRGSTYAIVVAALDSTEVTELSPDSGPALYASGWLLYGHNGTLVARAFDTDRLTLSGDPRPMGDAPTQLTGAVGGRFSVSANGVLVLQDAQTYDYQPVWYDRTGKQVGSVGPIMKVSVQALPRVSPDGKRVVTQRIDPQTHNQDLWIADLARGTSDRFTTDPAQEQLAFWSVDGKSVFCSTLRHGVGGIYRIPVSGGEDQLVLKGTVFPGDQSPDGKWLFYFQRGDATRLDIWALPLSGNPGMGADGPPHAVINSEFDESAPSVSPDGKWLAYTSDINGTAEVYVGRVTTDAKVVEPKRVSTGGGTEPKWSHDGRELFFVSAPQGFYVAKMMAVPVKTGDTTFESGVAVTLFNVHMTNQTTARDYDLSLDGQRFLVGTVVSEPRATPATIVLNWVAAVRK